MCAILTPDTKTALDLLVKSRRLVGISKENKFLFPRATGKSCLRGDKCLRDLASEADLEHPERIGSTNMRKYIATVVQVMYSYMVTYKRHILKPSNCFFFVFFFIFFLCQAKRTISKILEVKIDLHIHHRILTDSTFIAPRK